ncbi:hypothetical protein DSECCO2_117840 [anaerobic digester metagenome]
MNNHYQMTTELKTLAAYLGDAKTIAFDFETAPTAAWQGDKYAALDPHRAEIVGISLAVREGSGIYVPLGHRQGVNAPVRAIMDRPDTPGWVTLEITQLTCGIYVRPQIIHRA